MATRTFINFNNGLNKFISPILLDPSFSTELINANINNGALVPKKKDFEILKNIKRWEREKLKYNSIEFINGDENIPYYSDNTNGGLFYKNNKLSIEIPNNPLLNVSTANLSTGLSAGNYKYIMQFESNDGLLFSPLKDLNGDLNFKEVIITGDNAKSVTITGYNTQGFSGKVNFYRTVNGSNTYRFVGTVRTSQDSFTDSLNDSILITRPAFSLENNFLRSDVFDRGKFLAKTLVYWCVIGSNLYYSQAGEPFKFLENSFIPFSDEITAVLPVDRSLLVFTRNSTFRVLGSQINTIRIELVSNTIGMVSHKHGQTVRQEPIWFFGGDVYSYSYFENRDGRSLVNITERVYPNIGSERRTQANQNNRDSLENIVGTAEGVDSFFLFLTNKTIQIDFRLKTTIVELDDIFTAGYKFGELTILQNRAGAIVEYEQADITGSATSETRDEFYRLLTYKSVSLHFGEPSILKCLYFFQINCDERVEVTIDYGDNFQLSKTFVLEKGVDRTLLPNNLISKQFYLTLKSHGIIYSYNIVYHWLRRV